MVETGEGIKRLRFLHESSRMFMSQLCTEGIKTPTAWESAVSVETRVVSRVQICFQMVQCNMGQALLLPSFLKSRASCTIRKAALRLQSKRQKHRG